MTLKLYDAKIVFNYIFNSFFHFVALESNFFVLIWIRPKIIEKEFLKKKERKTFSSIPFSQCFS
jgi:hypothetical protein